MDRTRVNVAVGVFLVLGMLALGYLSIKLGRVSFFGGGVNEVQREIGVPVDAEIAELAREELREVYDHAFATYERLVEAGVARELARSVMPVGAYTEFFWTVNARALMNFVSLRAAETAQREIRRYADAVEQFFAAKMPVTHAAFVAANRVAP